MPVLSLTLSHPPNKAIARASHDKESGQNREHVVLGDKLPLLSVGKLEIGSREAVDEHLVASLDGLALGAGGLDLAGDGGSRAGRLVGGGEEDAARGRGLRLVGDDEEACPR